MPDTISVRTPGLLHIADGPAARYGADQTWYPTLWKRKAGCGPTVCAHILWYLSRTRDGCAPLCRHDGSRREGFVRLMEDVWEYVTPGMRGVNTTGIFTEGARRYGEDRGVPLSCRALEVPAKAGARPGPEEVFRFLARSLADDLPVAFLNLSNGSLANLDDWHWVTLLAADPRRSAALMYDQGSEREIDLGLWLRTTALGGGFVRIAPLFAQ